MNTFISILKFLKEQKFIQIQQARGCNFIPYLVSLMLNLGSGEGETIILVLMEKAIRYQRMLKLIKMTVISRVYREAHPKEVLMHFFWMKIKECRE